MHADADTDADDAEAGAGGIAIALLHYSAGTLKMKSCVSLSSTLPRVIDQSNLSDKFDRSMTLGKLLDNNAQLFIFIS